MAVHTIRVTYRDEKGRFGHFDRLFQADAYPAIFRRDHPTWELVELEVLITHLDRIIFKATTEIQGHLIDALDAGLIDRPTFDELVKQTEPPCTEGSLRQCVPAAAEAVDAQLNHLWEKALEAELAGMPTTIPAPGAAILAAAGTK